MQAISQSLNKQGRIVSTVQALPSGVAGTQKTLALMHESIIATLTHELLLNVAFIAAGLASRATSAKAEVTRVQQWVQKNIRYVLDPLKIELLQSPDVTLTRKQGDCDDQTALMCALLTALGYTCRMVAIGFAPGTYAHVYAEVNIDGQWMAAETIKPWPLGKTPDGVKATMKMVVNAPQGEALDGFFSAIKKNLRRGITKPLRIVKNPVGELKADLKRTVALAPAAAGGFASGGPWAALAATVLADVQMTAAKMAANKADAQAQNEFAQVADSTGRELAEAGGQPAKAAEFAATIKAAADPQKAVEEIILKFQQANIVPTQAAKAAALPANAGQVQALFEQYKTVAVIGGAALLVLLVLRK